MLIRTRGYKMLVDKEPWVKLSKQMLVEREPGVKPPEKKISSRIDERTDYFIRIVIQPNIAILFLNISFQTKMSPNILLGKE